MTPRMIAAMVDPFMKVAFATLGDAAATEGPAVATPDAVCTVQEALKEGDGGRYLPSLPTEATEIVLVQ